MFFKRSSIVMSKSCLMVKKLIIKKNESMKLLEISGSSVISAIDGNVLWLGLTLLIRGIEYYIHLRKKRKEQRNVSSITK